MVHPCCNKTLFSIVIVLYVYETINDMWTSAQDCQIIFCNLKKDNYKIEYNIPTRGFVFYITICLILHEMHLIAWHPVNENIIAYGIAGHSMKYVVSYLLCIHKIYKVVDVLQNAQMFKEAYCLVKSKLDSNDTMIKTILQRAYSEAIFLLAPKKDIETAKLELLSNENILSKSLVEQAIIKTLKNLYTSLAENIKFPQTKQRVYILRIFNYGNVVHNINVHVNLKMRKYIINPENSFIEVFININNKSPTEKKSIYPRKCFLFKSSQTYLCIKLLNWIVHNTNLSVNDKNIRIEAQIVFNLDIIDMIKTQKIDENTINEY
ncbi:LOW QUALITY PROTEIN: gem-associated protein 5-like isoform X1 [Vespula maculifrons]|uniref:Gem-associated protein 5-like isoform X1 n=1 Tax=Vespula maculifrons TaxID=7453 RepID=A0ABD2D2N1_VESMC